MSFRPFVLESIESRSRPLSHSVLGLIWTREGISRADIARASGLSRSTVSEIATELLESGLIVEGGDGPSRGGRRPVLLHFKDDAHVLLGVDMGGSHVTVVATDLRGRTLACEHTDHPVREDPTGTLGVIHDFIERCMDDVAARSRLLGIGVSVPSPVDPKNPGRLSEIILPAWQGYRLLDALEERYEVPIRIDNDANVGALAELWWGAGRSLRDFTFVKVATGIGAGHIVDGKIFRGSSGVAGELGHVAIDPEGDPCMCGNRGCLTTFASAAALLARIEELRPDFPDSMLARSGVTIHDLEEAALAGDPLAQVVVHETAEHLGTVLSGVLNLMNPGGIVIGGSLSRVGDRLLRPLRETLMRRTLVNSFAAAEIRASGLGPNGFAIGAATLILDQALEDPSLFPTMRSS